MQTLPHQLYRAEQVRAMDRVAIQAGGIPGNVLMERAGAAAFEALRARWPAARTLAVMCGVGNNGGDGFVVARLAREAGLDVRVFQVGDPEHIKGDALAARQRLQGTRLSPELWAHAPLPVVDVVVDALLGTGLQGEVTFDWRAAIAAINERRANGSAVLALDVPSGLHADTGQPLGVAVRAHATVTFIGLKCGLVTGAGPEYCGELLFENLRVPPMVSAEVLPAAFLLDYEQLKLSLLPRHRHAHKGEFGHVLIVGGEQGMSGAARMAAEAAARVGAGLVSVATRGEHAALLSAVRPELMCHGVESPAQLTPLLERASVVAIGPGLGQSPWAQRLLARVFESGLPLVVDADALKLLASEPERRGNWVLTPHPGEAAHLLGISAAHVQADRFAAAALLAQRFGGCVVLKGAGTLVQGAGETPGVCRAGNPGMASGGMGDILTGIIAGLIAQQLLPAEAARLGVCLHALAGDAAAKAGERGMLAGDLMSWVRRLANP